MSSFDDSLLFLPMYCLPGITKLCETADITQKYKPLSFMNGNYKEIRRDNNI